MWFLLERIPLPLGVWDGLRNFIVALPKPSIYTQQKSSAQMCFRVNPVLARNSCIQCYISLFTEIILQQFDAFKIEIQGTLTKL